ncbi:MAG TPA: HIT domain-containing protein [Candidatus Baltobacteraceae bacterium]|jgi:histidine triad (HIT) family protein|nr:HIT domain-containing protein [Candidatus Baltobacteraceae bacterium]
MSEASCIFCKIVAGDIPANFIHRDDEIVAIADVNPQAPRHVLVLPVRHAANVIEFAATADAEVVQKLLRVAGKIGSEDPGGFRLVMNTGPEGGQTVDHLHIHVLGGRPMTWPPG